MNKHERETAFRRELAELLEKYGAEIDLEETFHNYLHEAKIVVTLGTSWDKDGNTINEGHQFDLL